MVKLPSGIGDVLILDLPTLPARQALAHFDLLVGLESAAVHGLFGLDDINLVADIDPVGDGLLMGILAHDVLLEEPVGTVVWRGGQADEIGIEIFQDLTPDVVNRAVAFVDDDEVEELGRDPAVIHDRHRFSGLHHLGRVDLLGGFIHLLALQQRVHALDGTDANLNILGDEGRFQPLDVVQLGEFAVVVAGQVGLEFLLGLFAQIPGVYKKEDAPGVSVFEQPVDRGDGGVGLARAGRHLNEGARAVVLEGFFQILDGINLARSETRGVQTRKRLKPPTE